MNIWKPLLLPVLLFSLTSCSKPIPPEKSAYVGEWRENSMSLLITQDGTVRYRRTKGSSSTSIEAPLKGFKGDSFEVGVGPASTTFVVTRPPYQDGDKWKMVVDGVELIKIPDSKGPTTTI